MKPISILNDVLGPVMRGPSSSHTAGAFHIGVLARALLGGDPAEATFAFDPAGSFAQTYRQQGSDRGLVAGMMGWPITDERFLQALDLAAEQGFQASFEVRPLPHADHPNTVEIQAVARDGQRLHAVAQSVGGGAVIVTQVEGWPVHLTGDAHEVLVVVDARAEPAVRDLLTRDEQITDQPVRRAWEGQVLLHVRRRSPLKTSIRSELETLPGVHQVWVTSALSYVPRGAPLFSSTADMVNHAQTHGLSLGQAALAYESTLLDLTEAEVLAEVSRRLNLMQTAVHRGLEEGLPPMQLLQPSARRVYQADAEGQVAVGGLHTRAAARALAVMHVNGGMGVVCAAPTGGAAGTIPGTLVTLMEEQGLSPARAALALLAASAVGLVVAMRATFAAEVAGCQVEIGAAGAMAAAAVVEAAGGNARQATDAAAIAFQNIMGSVCDLVQGIVELPCHTRNAVAASSAFVCADLILGGYENLIPLDETVDAVYAVGQMLPRELRCTALGGLAQTPTGLAMPRLR